MLATVHQCSTRLFWVNTTVYPTKPSTENTLQKVTLSNFIADSTSMTLKFAMSSNDTEDRDIGINAVNCALGTYICREAFVDMPMFEFMYAYLYVR
jgi:hypothetical protein